MFDSKIRPIIDPPLNRCAQYINRCGISADTMTTMGLLFCLPLFAALYAQFYLLALFFLVLNRLADAIDGPVARQSAKGATDFGGYIDIVSDFIFYSGFVFFFAFGANDCAIAAGFLLFSFFVSGVSFLGYATIAAKRGMSTEKQGKKSFYYMAGLAEGTETIITFVLICLFPQFFEIIAVVFGLMCWVTAIGRTISAYYNFKEE